MSAYSAGMPLGAQDNLRKLYERQQLLSDEASRLDQERDQLNESSAGEDRRYILELEIDALREQATRIGSRIADILERDLQR